MFKGILSEEIKMFLSINSMKFGVFAFYKVKRRNFSFHYNDCLKSLSLKIGK